MDHNVGGVPDLHSMVALFCIWEKQTKHIKIIKPISLSLFKIIVSFTFIFRAGRNLKSLIIIKCFVNARYYYSSGVQHLHYINLNRDLYNETQVSQYPGLISPSNSFIANWFKTIKTQQLTFVCNFCQVQSTPFLINLNFLLTVMYWVLK